MKVQKALKAFSLVEGLLVVAMMALLAMLIIPSARKALGSARAAACAANLRQIGLGAHQYANEHDGRFPLFPQYFVAVEVFGHTSYYNNYALPKLWHCPGDEFIGKRPNALSSHNSYGVNGIAHIKARDAYREKVGNPTAYPPVEEQFLKFSRILRPSKTLYMVDTHYGNVETSSTTLLWDHTGMINAFTSGRHGSKINALFFDGHVEGLSGRESALYNAFLNLPTAEFWHPY